MISNAKAPALLPTDPCGSVQPVAKTSSFSTMNQFGVIAEKVLDGLPARRKDLTPICAHTFV